MKRTIVVIALVMAMLLLTVDIFARSGANVKSSPLFKHSLDAAIGRMENQGKQVEMDGNENIETTTPKCDGILKPPTSIGCETTEGTCEGEPTCYLGSCDGPTCSHTCTGGTCDPTCPNTCEYTCLPTCPATCTQGPTCYPGTCMPTQATCCGMYCE